MHRALWLVLSALLALLTVAPAGAAAPWPVPGDIVAEYDPPYPDWLPGHRGLDLAAPAGTPVRTPATGVLVWARSVGGVPVVVVQHGAARATYQPMTTTLPTGATVAAGQRIGTVTTGGHCSDSCLHWGLKLGDGYLDPRLLLGTPHVVLRPVD